MKIKKHRIKRVGENGIVHFEVQKRIFLWFIPLPFWVDYLDPNSRFPVSITFNSLTEARNFIREKEDTKTYSKWKKP